MDDESQEIDRNTLYQEVWAEPVTVVAKRYGLSDVGLAKACKRMRIPLPSRGYWAKVKAGKKMGKVPLPPMDPQAEQRVRITKPAEGALRVRQEAKEKAGEAKRQIGDVDVPEELVDPHPLVKAALHKLKQRDGWDSEKGLKSVPGEVLNVEVTRSSLDRALLIADVLIKLFAAQGIPVEVDTKSQKTLFDFNGTKVSFAITEYVRRTPHEATVAEKRARDRYWNSNAWQRPAEYPHIPQFDYHPTGILTITAGWYPSRSWKDTDRTQLEKRLGQVVAGFVSLAEEIRARDEEEARRQAARRQAEERYAFLTQRFDNEVSQFKDLEAEATDWERAARLRAYADAVEQQALGNGEIPEELREWLSWARSKADWLDPLVPVCDPILDAPKPAKPGYWGY